ncbi:hypothetical protein GCM10027347_38850 [Larkinella harenae]
MKKIATLLLLLGGLPAFGTHMVGGYIQVRNVQGLTYEITVRLYMDQSPVSAQTDKIEVCFDTGLSAVSVSRIQSVVLDGGVLMNEYRATHSYNGSGSGNRTISVSIPNRTDSRNAPMAFRMPVYFRTTFTTAQSNSTPTFQNLGQQVTGLVNQRNEYNFRASDADGDSIVYSLIRPQDGACGRIRIPVSPYTFPNDVTRKGTFKINAQNGQLVWNAPTETGRYSFAVMVKEWRNGLLISETIADMMALIVDNVGGNPGSVPSYEPAVESDLLTAVEQRIDDQDLTLTVFPSPSPGRFQVVLQSQKPTTATFQLLDSQGKMIQEVKANAAALEHRQSIGNEQLAPGLYLIRSFVRGRVYTSKVIKR